MFQSKEIATLKAALIEAQQVASTSTAALALAQAELASASTLNEAATAELATLKAASDELKTKLDAAEAAKIEAEKLATEAQTKVEAEVIARLAAAGVDPIKRDPKAKDGNGKVLSRAEFDALTSADQSAFCLAGGSIS